MTKAKTAKAKRPDYPKPLVRVKPVGGGWEAEVRTVAAPDAEPAAIAEGFQPVPVPEQAPDFHEYPKWVYHADGRRLIVQSADEEAAAEGFEESPPESPPEARESKRS